MDQQVSPAVVVIVLILIVAILVGLYFLVVERGGQPADEEAMMDMGPVDDEGLPVGWNIRKAGEDAEEDAEQTDADPGDEAEATEDAEEVPEG